MADNSINCDIARDLMPLVIDEIASDSAREAVEAHLEGCPACRKVMEDMRRAGPEIDASEGQDTAFIRFCRRMEKRFTLRHALTLALVLFILISALISFGTFVVYQTSDASADIAFAPRDVGKTVRLVQNRYGMVRLMFEVSDPRHPFYGSVGTTERTAEGVIIHCRPRTCAWPHLFGQSGMMGTVYDFLYDIRIQDGGLYELTFTEAVDEFGNAVLRRDIDPLSPIAEIWLGEGESAICLYRRGDPVDFPVAEGASTDWEP